VDFLKASRGGRGQERFYLFAGMGGRSARRKHRSFLLCALIAAAAVSLVLAGVFYWINTV